MLKNETVKDLIDLLKEKEQEKGYRSIRCVLFSDGSGWFLTNKGLDITNEKEIMFDNLDQMHLRLNEL